MPAAALKKKGDYAGLVFVQRGGSHSGITLSGPRCRWTQAAQGPLRRPP